MFKISASDGTFTTELTTDADGKIDLSHLDVGTYIVSEISAPTNYILDDTPQTIQLNKADEKTLLFENTLLPTLGNTS